MTDLLHQKRALLVLEVDGVFDRQSAERLIDRADGFPARELVLDFHGATELHGDALVILASWVRLVVEGRPLKIAGVPHHDAVALLRMGVGPVEIEQRGAN